MTRAALLTVDYYALIGDYLPTLPAWGTAGFVDPALGDDSGAWIGMQAAGAGTGAHLSVGFGTDFFGIIDMFTDGNSVTLGLWSGSGQSTLPMLTLKDHDNVDRWNFDALGGGLLGVLGKLVPDLDPWGEPGFVDPAAPDFSGGWIAFDVPDADLTVGWGVDGQVYAETFASVSIAGYDVQFADAIIRLDCGSSAGARLDMRVLTGQTGPVINFHDESGDSYFSVGPTVPSSDPHILGRVYNLAGALMISAG